VPRPNVAKQRNHAPSTSSPQKLRRGHCSPSNCAPTTAWENGYFLSLLVSAPPPYECIVCSKFVRNNFPRHSLTTHLPDSVGVALNRLNQLRLALAIRLYLHFSCVRVLSVDHRVSVISDYWYNNYSIITF